MNIKSTKLLLVVAVGLAATAAATENLLLAAPVLVGGWIASRSLLRALSAKTESTFALPPAAEANGSKDLLTAWAEVATESRREGTGHGMRVDKLGSRTTWEPRIGLAKLNGFGPDIAPVGMDFSDPTGFTSSTSRPEPYSLSLERIDSDWASGSGPAKQISMGL